MKPKDIFTYSCFVEYEEYECFQSLKELYDRVKENYILLKTSDFYIGQYHAKSGEKGEIYYKDNIYNKKELSEEEIKEIEDAIDEEIEKTEKFIRSIGNGQTVTGFFGPTKNDRETYIRRSIQRKSLSVKTFEELDQSKFIYKKC